MGDMIDTQTEVAETQITFRTLEKACAYLRAIGRRCAKSKLAKDTALGLCARTADGSYTKLALDKYGEAHCTPLSGVDVEEADDYWRKRKQRAEAKKLEHEAEIKELQKRRERNELIERPKVYRELAARIAVLRADFENWTHETAIQIADRYGIEAARVGELQQDLAEAGEEWFAKYGDRREFLAHLIEGDMDE